MSSAQRNAIFFGSLSATIIGHDVADEAVVSALVEQGASLKLRLTATAASYRVEEVFGAVSSSAPMPIAGDAGVVEGGAAAAFPIRMRQSFFLPLMLQLAQDPAADGLSLEEESDAEDSSEGAEGSATRGKSARRAGDPGYYAVTANISADVSRGNSRAVMVRTKRVVVASLNRSAAHDTCLVVRVGLSSRLLQQSTGTAAAAPKAEEMEKEVVGADVALTVYVLLRVVDLSARLGAAEEAADSARRFLGIPPPIPFLSVGLTKRVAAPYGAMPLAELYKHYRLFYSQYFSRVLKPSAEVVRILTTGTPGLEEAEQSYPYRWNALEEVRLDRVLLGEEGFAPLLLTLSHCTNLRCLVADQNELSDITCARICALLARHRYLRTVSVAKNSIYEGGADQLLRLARLNHRLSTVALDGNWCTEAIQQRVAAVTAASQRGTARDPLNVFADQFAYLTSPAAIPSSTLRLALGVWAMLTAAPAGDVDVWVRNSTTRDMDQYLDESLAPRLRANKAAAIASASIVPPAARAPLLGEVMRTVYVGVSMAVQDPLVRSVFVDLEEARRKRLETLRSRPDAVADGGDSDGAESGDSLGAGAGAGADPRSSSGSAGSDGLVGDLPAEIADVLRVRAAAAAASGGGSGDAGLAGVDVPQLLADTEDDIYNASFLKIVVTTMRGIANGSSWEEVAAVLRGVGALHRSLGVRIEDYWLAVHVFVKGLGVCLGADEMTPDRLAAFLLTMALGIRTAVSENGVVPAL